jgi:hypothetical protein
MRARYAEQGMPAYFRITPLAGPNILAALDVDALALPEAYLHYSDGMFTEDGALAERSRDFVGKWLKAFLAHAERQRAPR